MSTLNKAWHPAWAAAGRPDLRWHDLRHTGAVFAAQAGATLAELMARLGHSTHKAALRYQHAAADRDARIAEALSAMVEAGSPASRRTVNVALPPMPGRTRPCGVCCVFGVCPE
ncbi:hypothetical protein [uncultured Ornithinimicrobium sp.]|uniref:hypothetical protein n=1 Tax=uncultured Ornithinimicrobium sp. TaxID=259307 RepID=UPI002591A59B|nr:hypothetical protein [uncultured Ornithinimicrobium sp.]